VSRYEVRIGRNFASVMTVVFCLWMVQADLTSPARFAGAGLMLVPLYGLFAWVVLFPVGWAIGVLLQVDWLGREPWVGEPPFAGKVLAAVVVVGAFVFGAAEYVDREHLYSLAESPKNDPAEMRSIWHGYWGRRDDLVRNALARDTASPPDVLLEIAVSSDLNLTPPWGLRGTAKPLLKSDVEELIENQNTPDAVLERFSWSDRRIRYQLAQRPGLPEGITRRLACDSDVQVRDLVARETGVTCRNPK
jgi:hypothetical protein